MSIDKLVIDLGKKEHPNLTYTALSWATLRGNTIEILKKIISLQN